MRSLLPVLAAAATLVAPPVPAATVEIAGTFEVTVAITYTDAVPVGDKLSIGMSIYGGAYASLTSSVTRAGKTGKVVLKLPVRWIVDGTTKTTRVGLYLSHSGDGRSQTANATREIALPRGGGTSKATIAVTL
ncbi:hypothetical protein [Oharaeibacter diazotrophicus]|uniref:Uncharacterized protein n=1 Tax=Oharaeibacter diazotrophicus TaxID=1920512 RepID=A0A4R6RL44_9HYPH|nr:hypothetical protein [Oharaeibacter diazotrophicus]TDP86825.1 hypothetical protein EDD54_0709 [Oharaeibacter diazotrophicus]BBE71232.1 hypothetical protein OHA_1_00802 [Pleomorphomonas sp. SM30]GLS77986.1 hypothetical protein GCM10007904_33230 [Oharaeibacter diazotrophicus]